ncbi:MAG: hypothetical protein DRJ03_21020 [Chloroflexi bacterium]|nr:MAG: hypothetical protein B6I35_11610 [Anaerolineaceae bacterium 4572_32.2]RLC74557.1 MAG: hypothetical protein DRI81_13615 [Chloroflexota bacterium]RLC80784.1 MAG: hypothetical protein DRJ03_21020 [Chloroflexota bacterium]HEY73814.1 hypothetical protein [Thermoflexia bacterium]
MQERTISTRLVADFFTHSHRLSGSVDVRYRNLADQLNNQSTSFIQLDDVYVSSVACPADITASHATSILRKPSIIAVVVTQQDSGLPREHTYGSYFGAHLRKISAIVPNFEIEGYLRIAGRWAIQTVLTSGTDDFIPILDGQMRAAAHPDTVFAGGAILINKSHIAALCEEKEE